MKSFVDGLQSLFNQWKIKKPSVEKTEPLVQPTTAPASEQSYTSKALTYVASFIPGASALAPVASTQEKSWYSSYLPW
jgi:hypothetical protein